MASFEVLITKAMFDHEFGELLKSDPAKALKEVGIAPTPERLAAIAKIDFAAVDQFAKEIGTSQSRTMN